MAGSLIHVWEAMHLSENRNECLTDQYFWFDLQV